MQRIPIRAFMKSILSLMHYTCDKVGYANQVTGKPDLCACICVKKAAFSVGLSAEDYGKSGLDEVLEHNLKNTISYLSVRRRWVILASFQFSKPSAPLKFKSLQNTVIHLLGSQFSTDFQTILALTSVKQLRLGASDLTFVVL